MPLFMQDRFRCAEMCRRSIQFPYNMLINIFIFLDNYFAQTDVRMQHFKRAPQVSHFFTKARYTRHGGRYIGV